jgi:hypothetical protein
MLSCGSPTGLRKRRWSTGLYFIWGAQQGLLSFWNFRLQKQVFHLFTPFHLNADNVQSADDEESAEEEEEKEKGKEKQRPVRSNKKDTEEKEEEKEDEEDEEDEEDASEDEAEGEAEGDAEAPEGDEEKDDDKGGSRIKEFYSWARNPFKDKKANCASVDSFDKIYTAPLFTTTMVCFCFFFLTFQPNIPDKEFLFQFYMVSDGAVDGDGK